MSISQYLQYYGPSLFGLGVIFFVLTNHIYEKVKRNVKEDVYKPTINNWKTDYLSDISIISISNLTMTKSA